jgi:dihydroneopterin aldolase
MICIELDTNLSASKVTVMPFTTDAPNHACSHTLFIKDCSVQTWIGVYEHEQKTPTILIFDIELDVDARQAASSDLIGDTVDYAVVVSFLREYLRNARHRLLETLTQQVADQIFSTFNVSRVRLSVAKTGILEGVASVGVEIVRFRNANSMAMATSHLASLHKNIDKKDPT